MEIEADEIQFHKNLSGRIAATYWIISLTYFHTRLNGQELIRWLQLSWKEKKEHEKKAISKSLYFN